MIVIYVRRARRFSLHWWMANPACRKPWEFGQARVAKLADAKDLKSFLPKGECGFKSRPGHQIPRSTLPLPLAANAPE